MRKVAVSALRPGMVLAKSVYGQDGQLFLQAGVTLKSTYINGLGRRQIPFVYVGDPLLWDVEVKEVITEETRRQTVKMLNEMLNKAKNSRQTYYKQVLLDNRFRSSVEKLVKEVLNNKDVVVNLSDIRVADDYTFCHSVNVCVLSLLTGTCAGMSVSQLEQLGTGALLHDMGKIWVDEQILKKEGSLTPDEFSEIKKHPLFGFDILSQQSNISDESNQIVIQHHERCNGSGYPHGLKQNEIHKYSKLVSIVDVYDALTADRPYRRAYRPHEAIEILSSTEGLYDEELYHNFLSHLSAYPVGTAVRLSNQDLGLVVKNYKGAPLRPLVRVIKDGDSAYYNPPFEVDLIEILNLVIVDVLSDTERETELPIQL